MGKVSPEHPHFGKGPALGSRPHQASEPCLALPYRSPSMRTAASRAATMSAAPTTPTCSPTSAAATLCAWTVAAGCSMSSPTSQAASTSCVAGTTLTTSSGWVSVTLSAPAASSPTPVLTGSRSTSERTTEAKWWRSQTTAPTCRTASTSVTSTPST
uniref:Crystallin, gamma E n=1 Tax=Mus musculus TaxID=10090 RepID=E0CXE4_MOUSE